VMVEGQRAAVITLPVNLPLLVPIPMAEQAAVV